nr:hypothetical protein [Solidesulfovibrio alcoholivorans]
MTIDNVIAPEFPVVLPFLAIGTSWEKDTGGDVVENFSIRISHVSPEGKVSPFIETGNISMHSYRHRMNFVLNGASFDRAGTHHFNIEARINDMWACVASLPVFVSLSRRNDASAVLNAVKQ